MPSRSGRNNNRGGHKSQTPPKPELDAGEHLHLVGEDRAAVEPAVAVGVFEDQHAVALAEVEPLGSLGVRVVLGDPEPPARSQAMAIGFCTSGSAAKTETWNPSGTRNPAAAAAGDIGSAPAVSVFRGRGKSSAAASRGKIAANARMPNQDDVFRFITGDSQLGTDQLDGPPDRIVAFSGKLERLIHSSDGATKSSAGPLCRNRRSRRS